MIAALRKGQLLAAFTVEGSCHRNVFETWLETCLIPVLEPGQVGKSWITRRFIRVGTEEQLIREAGCELLYLYERSLLSIATTLNCA